MQLHAIQKIEYCKKRLAQNKRHACNVVSALAPINEKKSYKIGNCAARLAVSVNDDGKLKLKTWYCKQNKLCPTCNKIRSFKLTEKLNSKIMHAGLEALHVKHLILTIRNGKQLKNRFDYMVECKEGLRKLRSRGRAEWANVVAAFGSIELSTDTSNQYHVHIHLIVFSAEPLDADLLRDEWQAIAGGGSHLNDCPIANNNHIETIAGYINKLPEVEPDCSIKWANITHGRHLFFTWGTLRGVVPAEPKPNQPDVDAEYSYFEWSEDVGEYVDIDAVNDVDRLTTTHIYNI